MSQPDGFSPQFPGSVTAKYFTTTLTGSPSAIPQTVKVSTNGTTEVNIFGTTNGVTGTFTGLARITSKDDADGNITLQNDAGTTLFTIAKGSQGAVKGTAFSAVAFTANGTATIKSSAASNAIVEIDFIVANPQLG